MSDGEDDRYVIGCAPFKEMAGEVRIWGKIGNDQTGRKKINTLVLLVSYKCRCLQ